MQNLLSFRYIKFTCAAVVIFALQLLSSCEKEVHININAGPPVLVVEGQIETGQPPIVILSSTIGFFSTIDLNTLENSFIHGANVQVSNGTQTVTLKEYSIDTGNNAKFYVYTVDTANLGNSFVGVVNQSYTLTIKYNGQTYTSTTKIPAVHPIDSMWLDKPSSFGQDIPPQALQLYVSYTDPDTLGNYVRAYTKRDRQQYISRNVYSDEVINGTTVPMIGISIGYQDTAAKADTLRYVYPGDTITVKWCGIDKGVYNFWNTFAFAQQSVGNPFASPITVQSNISNGALGVWAGYGSSFRTIILH